MQPQTRLYLGSSTPPRESPQRSSQQQSGTVLDFWAPNLVSFLPTFPPAAFLARVDPDVIRLIGRWRSDEMLRYLHVQAYSLMKDYSRLMLSSGDYTLIPNQLVPQR